MTIQTRCADCVSVCFLVLPIRSSFPRKSSHIFPYLGALRLCPRGISPSRSSSSACTHAAYIPRYTWSDRGVENLFHQFVPHGFRILLLSHVRSPHRQRNEPCSQCMNEHSQTLDITLPLFHDFFFETSRSHSNLANGCPYRFFSSGITGS